MSAYDDRARRYHDPRDARSAETQEYRVPSQELVPRSSRVDSDLPVDSYGYERDMRRARSAGPYHEDDYYGSRYGDPRDYDGRSDRRRSKKSSKFYIEEERARRRMLSKEQKIMAALAGAALFAGGKEFYDRHEAKEEGTAIHRNPLASAALGAAGALAGYQGAEMYSKQNKHKARHVVRGKDGRVEEDYWTDDSSDDEGHKKHGGSFLKNAVAAAGLGKAFKSMTGGGDDRSERSYRSRSTRRSSYSSSRSRSRSESAVEKIQKAAMASLLAGASEAFRVSKQPGSWKGEKTKRILTAAISAGGIDAAHDAKSRKVGLLESVMGGLVANRAIHGSKKDIEEDKYTGRSRSRSRARSEGGGKSSGAVGPAAAILGAIAGKKLLDRSRSHSRSRSRSRGRRGNSVDSFGSAHSKRSLRDRSRSAVRKLLGKTGISDEDERYERRHSDEYYDDEPPRRSRRHRDHGARSRSRSRSVASYRDRPRGGGDSDSDLGSSSDDEAHYKKMKAPSKGRRH